MLFAATSLSAVHLLVLVRALFPVHVLFVGVEVQQGQNFTASVVGPERGNDFLFDRASVSEKGKK